MGILTTDTGDNGETGIIGNHPKRVEFQEPEPEMAESLAKKMGRMWLEVQPKIIPSGPVHFLGRLLRCVQQFP